MTTQIMRHYVKQEITKGATSKTVGDYSAPSIKHIVLYLMQQDFKAKYNQIKYDITTDKENLLNKCCFYKTGITYEQIKGMSEDDVEDMCMMITTEKDRSSLNYIRICPYLHKTPITMETIESNDTFYNKKIKPIKLKIIPRHHLRHYTEISQNTVIAKHGIKHELAKAFNLPSGKQSEDKHFIKNHISKALVSFGIDLNNIDYHKIPKAISDVMMVHSRYFKGDYKTSYHKKFNSFFNDYFQISSHEVLPEDYFISPYLASHFSLDINKSYKRDLLLKKLQSLGTEQKYELYNCTKQEWISQKKLSNENILKYHTYSSHVTDDFVNIRFKANKILLKKYRMYHRHNVLKSGIILQRFYRNTVKPVIEQKKASVTKPKKSSKSKPKTVEEPKTPETLETTDTESDTSLSE